MSERWDIRVEPFTGVQLNTGELVVGARLRYRPAGSRGRFRSVTVIGGLKGASPASIVDRYEAGDVTDE